MELTIVQNFVQLLQCKQIYFYLNISSLSKIMCPSMRILITKISLNFFECSMKLCMTASASLFFFARKVFNNFTKLKLKSFSCVNFYFIGFSLLCCVIFSCNQYCLQILIFLLSRGKYNISFPICGYYKTIKILFVIKYTIGCI